MILLKSLILNEGWMVSPNSSPSEQAMIKFVKLIQTTLINLSHYLKTMDITTGNFFIKFPKGTENKEYNISVPDDITKSLPMIPPQFKIILDLSGSDSKYILNKDNTISLNLSLYRLLQSIIKTSNDLQDQLPTLIAKTSQTKNNNPTEGIDPNTIKELNTAYQIIGHVILSVTKKAIAKGITPENYKEKFTIFLNQSFSARKNSNQVDVPLKGVNFTLLPSLQEKFVYDFNFNDRTEYMFDASHKVNGITISIKDLLTDFNSLIKTIGQKTLELARSNKS